MAEYRILICGDRNWSDYDMILGFVSSLPKNSIIINGMAKGADKMAGKAGEANGLEVLKFPADWSGPKKKAAGIFRNIQMIEEGLPTHVIAYHNDIQNSKGTKHMVSISLKAGVPTYLNVKHWVDIELGMKQIEIDGPKKEKEVDLF